MLIETIQAELQRLRLHPVNLSVSRKDDCLIELHGSLLKPWKMPEIIDDQRLLKILQTLPDAAGAETVMTALCNAQMIEGTQPATS